MYIKSKTYNESNEIWYGDKVNQFTPDYVNCLIYNLSLIMRLWTLLLKV